MKRLSAAALALLAAPLAASAYPGGTPTFVTDIAPFCASCHSSVSVEALAGLPEARAQAELAANKHLAQIRAPKPESAYAKLSEAQRTELARAIEALDAAARVRLVAPPSVAPGQSFEVTVESTGGGGPVIGLALVDAAHRFQARPAASAGWQIADKPLVRGPDGALQTRFTDGRNPALPPAVSYVNVYDVSTADAARAKWASASVTWKLRAPTTPGAYPLVAVFLYGTEKGSPHGSVETLQGKGPIGGFGGAAGRVRFSDVMQIQVKPEAR
jgi:cytochrome c553